MPWQAWVIVVWFVVNMLVKISYGANGKVKVYEPVDAIDAPITYGFLLYCIWAVAT